MKTSSYSNRLEAKLALPAPTEPLYTIAGGVITYKLFECKDELLVRLSKLGDSASWCFDRNIHNPVVFVRETRASDRAQGVRQLTMDAASIINHRLALRLCKDGDENPVYCLLQIGKDLELFVAYSEATGRKIVCSSVLVSGYG